MILDRLVSLAEPLDPVEQPGAGAWRAFESQAGVRLPKEFKDLVSRFGNGSFGRGLYLKNPCSTSSFTVLSVDALIAYREVIGSRTCKRAKVSLYPDEGGLIVVAGIDRQHWLLQLGNGDGAARVVALDVDVDEATVVGDSVQRLIYDLYVGNLDSRWAKIMRAWIWPDSSVRFFTARVGAMDKSG